eukprot:gb/GEZN01011364.1/.p1 GENE.gb/GEZN01011364.1/~~gb/GEZN01011364.1/.p1  ORF type:complete len:369 (+),score=42.72 gb/GEZN01011364.1/:26-1108(+)
MNPIRTFTIRNGDLVAQITTYGATLLTCLVPDRHGIRSDVVLGFDTPHEHELHPGSYFGGTIGRFANRIGSGKFSLNNTSYQLSINNGKNHLHGGSPKGAFDTQVWAVDLAKDVRPDRVRMTLESPDGTEGYPGHVSVAVSYAVTKDNSLEIEYTAALRKGETKSTIINMANHAFWNLEGQSSSALDHVLSLPSSTRYCPVDAECIPTGKILPTKDTEFDLPPPGKLLSAVIPKCHNSPAGLDNNYVIDRATTDVADATHRGKLLLAAVLTSPKTGRQMEVWTTQPGMQVYTGNFLDGSVSGKMRNNYERHGAVCLETQNYPDAPNRPNFPSSVLPPGKTYNHLTVHKFKTVDEQIKSAL